MFQNGRTNWLGNIFVVYIIRGNKVIPTLIQMHVNFKINNVYGNPQGEYVWEGLGAPWHRVYCLKVSNHTRTKTGYKEYLH